MRTDHICVYLESVLQQSFEHYEAFSPGSNTVSSIDFIPMISTLYLLVLTY